METLGVATDSGPVVGRIRRADPLRRRSRDTAVFLGIPVATSERFGLPQPPRPWTTPREAFMAAPVAPQPPSVLEGFSGRANPDWSERDCLAVNVFTPGCDDGRRPVLVWIHGGAFLTGSGSSPWYNGTRFAANHDVVVVSINYRLGAFGFLHLDDLAGSGNAGIADQVAALAWVNEHVAGFGGDPGNVTIFGESAGAMSVATLIAVPAAVGLFRRAILQSGAAAHVHDALAATRTAMRLQHALGIEPGARDAASRLMRVGAADLLAAQNSIANLAEGRLLFQPMVDGTVVSTHPLAHLRSGKSAALDLLVGTTADEMQLFTMLDPAVAALDRTGLVRRTAAEAGIEVDQADEIVAAFIAARPGRSMAAVWSALATDIVFRAPAHRLLAAHEPHGRCWQYEFRWRSRAFGGRLGSCHALELPFVFDNLDAEGVEMFTGVGLGADNDDRPALAEAMHRAWAAFARTGDPNGTVAGRDHAGRDHAGRDHAGRGDTGRGDAGRGHADSGTEGLGPRWPAWTAGDRATMVFDGSLSVEHRPRADELDVWL